MGRPIPYCRPGRPASSITGWLTVSVIPYQARVRTRKISSSGGDENPLPQKRNQCRGGTSCLSRARTQKGATDVHVHRLRTATSQNREAENPGCSTTVPPTQSDASVE